MEDGFKSLVTWQKAYKLVLKVYRLTQSFPKDERYALISQMRRAAVSVVGNIAEGYERRHLKEYIQFLMIAKGSLGELETYFLLSRDLGYLAADGYTEIETGRKEVIKLLIGLAKSVHA